MEAVGLVVGIVGLFSSCLDALDRFDSYKDFEAESSAIVAQFEADKTRFRKWGQHVGIDQHRLRENHHEALDDPEVLSVVEYILGVIENPLDSDNIASKLQSLPQFLTDHSPTLNSNTLHRALLERNLGSTSRRTRIGWAIRGRQRLSTLAQRFNALVETLHHLVPPKDLNDLCQTPAITISELLTRIDKVWKQSESKSPLTDFLITTDC
jgi:hypothetical protein